MRLLARAPEATEDQTTVLGTARVDRRTKNLVRRLKRGDIAVVHHADMDALAARALIDAGVVAVINAVASATGRYPNTGPMLLIEAGIPLLDEVGEPFFASVRDGTRLEVADCTVRTDVAEAQGRRVDIEHAQQLLTAGMANLGRELSGFAQNTLEHMNAEWRCFFEPLRIPDLSVDMRDRHVVVVTRGSGYDRDLAAIRSYIREERPVLVAVDGAADTLLARGMTPNIIIGDMDSISHAALSCGAEVLVHGYLDSNKPAPGIERCRAAGVTAKVIRAPGTSEDLAMLLAHELGAQLIVAVGAHFSMEEFLDKGREGMSSTFLTRLKTGSKLVDAKGVSQLYSERNSKWDFVWLVGSAMLMVLVAAALTPLGRTIITTVRTWVKLHLR